MNAEWNPDWRTSFSDAYLDLLENLRAYIKLVYPEEMTPQAKRILEQIIERHEKVKLRPPALSSEERQKRADSRNRGVLDES